MDATERRNPYADARCWGNLRRWLLSAFSSMREPALRHLVELCMKKVFTLLLAEVKKLGATVIHADASITVATGKTRLASAAAFVDGLRASLRRRELFSWLELEPSRQWHSLVFRGPFDYGGLLAPSLPGASAWSGHDTQGPDDFELDPATARAKGASDAAEALDMHWNIASFLPESLREHFEVIVSEFIFRPWKHEHGGGLDDDEEAGRRRRGVTTRARGRGRRGRSEAPREFAKEGRARRDASAARRWRQRDATRWVARRRRWRGTSRRGSCVWLGRSRNISAPEAREFEPRAASPTPPGAHLSERFTARSRAGVRQDALRGSVAGYRVRGARRASCENALKLFAFPEYAPEAEFREPCVTFVLRDAVCELLRRVSRPRLVPRRALVEDGAMGLRHVWTARTTRSGSRGTLVRTSV